MTYTPFDPGSSLRITLPILHQRPADAFEELHLNFVEQYHYDLETIFSDDRISTHLGR